VILVKNARAISLSSSMGALVPRALSIIDASVKAAAFQYLRLDPETPTQKTISPIKHEGDIGHVGHVGQIGAVTERWFEMRAFAS
jgi:hypothetical protein